jgi:hypothetical protein
MLNKGWILLRGAYCIQGEYVGITIYYGGLLIIRHPNNETSSMGVGKGLTVPTWEQAMVIWSKYCPYICLKRMGRSTKVDVTSQIRIEHFLNNRLES